MTTDRDRAGLSTVARLDQTAATTDDEAVRRKLAELEADADPIVDALIRRAWSVVKKKLAVPLATLLGAGGGGGVVGYVNSPKHEDDTAEARTHETSGAAPPDHPPNPELVEAIEQCKADTRLAIDTCVEQAKACGAAEVPRPRHTPDPYERTP